MRPPGHRPKFAEPRYFDYLKSCKRWRCNACRSSPSFDQNDEMTGQAALRHEKTPEHKESVRAREEWNPLPDEDGWNTNTGDRIDQLRDFIPYWRKSIEAAEYGETLRFEDFLNALHGKEKEEVVWNLPMPDWTLDVDHQSAGKGHAQSSDSGHDLDPDAFDFVEKVATMDSADSERRQRLHSFYKMPTNEKVNRIRELINTLRTARRAS